MTTQTTVTRTDDLTGEPAARQIVLGLDQILYAIDLSDQSEAELREALAPFIHAGTVIGGIRSRTGRTGRALAAAAVTGRPMPASGRIREAMTDAYR